MNKIIPAYLFSGFLGSGKTTLLLKVISYYKEKGMKPAVILNELGEKNVEKDLFEKEELIEMLNGCICCTIQTDLTNEVKELLRDNHGIDVLLIEGTGVANPEEVMEALTNPSLIEKVSLQSIISVVDASKYLEYQSIFSSSKEIRKVLKEQITNASLIIVNKQDLINEKTRKKVRKKIEELKGSYVEVIETEYGSVDLEEILKRRMERLSFTANTKKEHSHEHHHHSHHSFQTILLQDVPTLERTQLQTWLHQLPQTVIRVKGIVALAGDRRIYQLQYASGQMKISNINTREVETCLIIIGVELNGASIKESFEQVFLS